MRLQNTERKTDYDRWRELFKSKQECGRDVGLLVQLASVLYFEIFSVKASPKKCSLTYSLPQLLHIQNFKEKKLHLH
jgi:hypothetical protein